MRLLGQFQACLFFYEKDLSVKKHSQAKINQQNKVKQTLNKGNNFYARKNLKVVSFTFWCFFYAQKTFSHKKINRLEIVLITSLYYTANLDKLFTARCCFTPSIIINPFRPVHFRKLY